MIPKKTIYAPVLAKAMVAPKVVRTIFLTKLASGWMGIYVQLEKWHHITNDL